MTTKKKIFIIVLCCLFVFIVSYGVYVYSYVHYSLTAVTKDTTPEEMVQLWFKAKDSNNTLLYDSVTGEKQSFLRGFAGKFLGGYGGFLDRFIDRIFPDPAHITHWKFIDATLISQSYNYEYKGTLYYAAAGLDVTFSVTTNGDSDYESGKPYHWGFGMVKENENSKWMITGYGVA